MIYKDLDGFDAQDKFRIAGRKAEEQMAFYLRRFFSDSAEVDVLNGLRIELDGEVAQMDHLVLHPFGLLIVESKSVVESIQLEDDGQWVRWYSGRPQGMRSPITQARMQAMLLKALLNQKVKQPGVFDRLQLDVLVAISDQGRIQWPSTGPLLEVCKADQVPDRITQKIKEAAQTNGSAFLHAQNRQRIAQFLGLMHKPLPLSAPTLTPAPATSPASTPQPVPTPQRGQLPPNTCKHCGSNEVEGRYGQYGYYLACRRCEKNTGLKFTCPACGGEGRVRKAGLEFFAECKLCTASVRFHRN